MQKVTIIGCGGAGKSTFSRILWEVLNIPVHHLDKLNWKPGWVPTPKNKWENIVVCGNIISRPK